jgi:hypothetical protein
MEQAMTRRADSLDSIVAPALSPQGDSNPPTSSTAHAPIDRAALMKRAHLIARRFIGILPNYRACLAHGMRCAWADTKARQELKQAYGHLVRRPLTAKQIADSRYFTRRSGSSFT